jgi:hypothetical protein
MGMGFLEKSGVDFPNGTISINWVTVAPGTLEVFLIATVEDLKQAKKE